MKFSVLRQDMTKQSPVSPGPPTWVQCSADIICLELINICVPLITTILRFTMHFELLEPGEHNVGDVLYARVAINHLS